jgi:hypothetical protein
MHGQPDDLYEDALIAATALAHDPTVVTRDAADSGISGFNRSTRSRCNYLPCANRSGTILVTESIDDRLGLPLPSERRPEHSLKDVVTG